MFNHPLSNSLEKAFVYFIINERNFAKNHEYIAKSFSPIVASIEASYLISSSLCDLVEHTALCAINLIGSAFSFITRGYLFKNCNITDSLKCLRFSLNNISQIINGVLSTPFDICFQTMYLFKNPTGDIINVQNWLNPTKKATTEHVETVKPNLQKNSYLQCLIISIKNVASKIINNPHETMYVTGYCIYFSALLSKNATEQCFFLLSGTLMIISSAVVKIIDIQAKMGLIFERNR